MDNLLIDTNVLIDFSKGKSKLLARLLEKQEQGKVVLYINPIIIAEYFTDDKLEKEENFQKASEFISLFNISQINKKDGLTAGQLLRKKQANFIADGLIAANCLENDFKLVTRNIKHFENIPNLQLYR